MILPSSTSDRKSPVPSDEKPGPASTEDEKQVYESQTISLVDSSDGDEALKLVGREREVQFSDEYNRKLRNKLVGALFFSRGGRTTYRTLCTQDRIIPPLCAAVYFTQFL